MKHTRVLMPRRRVKPLRVSVKIPVMRLGESWSFSIGGPYDGLVKQYRFTKYRKALKNNG